MGTDKRERQKANRAARLEEQRAAEAKAKRRQQLRTIVVAGVAIVAIMLLVSVLSGCSSDGSEGATEADGSFAGEATTTEFTGDGTAPDDAAPDPDAPLEYGTGECAPAEGVDEPVVDFDDAPQQCIDPTKTYTATFETTKGTLVVELDTERSPLTTNNFVNLARWGYYDGTDIHRVVASAGFVQGGSPKTQDAADPGPGYTIPDEGGPFTAEDYVPGILAMARTAAPNSAGGQYFFLSNDGGTQALASYGTYTVFGRTTEGLELLEEIAQLEVPGTEAPSEPVIVEKVTITES
jgi:cyclophilin family peptidyl-prolyl cis-trans isomerase